MHVMVRHLIIPDIQRGNILKFFRDVPNWLLLQFEMIGQ